MVIRVLRSWQLMAVLAVIALGIAVAAAVAQASGPDIPTAADGFGVIPDHEVPSASSGSWDPWQIAGTAGTSDQPPGPLADGWSGASITAITDGTDRADGATGGRGADAEEVADGGRSDAADGGDVEEEEEPAPGGVTSGGAGTGADDERDAPPVDREAHAPVGVRVPALAVDAPTLPMGLRPNGEIEVPETPEDTGWWADGPTPGAPGPTVLLGHVNDWAGPGVFNGLHALTPGDEVFVDRADGSTVVYAVSAGALYLKDEFPTDLVYLARSDTSLLRLVTCGGALDRQDGSYNSNYIVFAEQVRIEHPAVG